MHLTATRAAGSATHPLLASWHPAIRVLVLSWHLLLFYKRSAAHASAGWEMAETRKSSPFPKLSRRIPFRGKKISIQ